MSYSERQFKQAVTWFVRLQSEHSTTEDQQQFEAWLEKNAAHSVAYAQAEKLWQRFDELKTVDLSNARRKPKSRTATIASILLVAALSGGLVYEEFNAKTLHYSTKQGEQQHIALSDGSTVDLNTDTAIDVKVSWLQRRVELVHGEALFTVQHQAWRKFTVQADDLTIRDVGTVFNVAMQTDGVAVAVLEGEVELSNQQALKQNLTAGHQRFYSNKQTLTPETETNHDQVTAWLNGKLVFNHTPLAKVTAELERYHAVKFKFAQTQLANETLSGTFNAHELNAFLQAIEPMLGIHAKRQNNLIILQRKKT